MKVKSAKDSLIEIIDNKCKNKPDDMVVRLYYDYDDYADIGSIKDYDSYEDFKDNLLEELMELNDAYVFDLIDDSFNEFKDSYSDLFDELTDDEEEEVSTHYSEMIEVDYNEDELIEKTKLRVNIMPYQDYNLDTEGSEMYEALSFLAEGEDKSQYKGNDMLDRLFKSQGYEDITKIDWDNSNDPFIESFIEEYTEADLAYTWSQFFVFLAEMSIKDYFDLLTGKSKMIYRSGVCGLFNPVTGSGSMLDVILNKPFTIEFTGKENFDGIQVEGVSSYGYSVDSIYGLVESCWDNADYSIVDKEGDRK